MRKGTNAGWWVVDWGVEVVGEEERTRRERERVRESELVVGSCADA